MGEIPKVVEILTPAEAYWDSLHWAAEDTFGAVYRQLLRGVLDF